MKTALRIGLAALTLAIASPAIISAQSPCPTGYTYVALQGGGFSCVPNASTPEISTHMGGAGLALVAGLAMVIRGRKRISLNA
jgi:hypothetical protein